MAEKPKSKRFIDLEGSRFGYFTVKSFSGIHKSATYWNVVCDCGEDRVVCSGALINGKSKSCGCLRAELSRTRTRIHGESGVNKTPELRSWEMMRVRCNNPNNHKFPMYGGRGIKVCERWDSYENFLEDMGRRPSLNHSIDRINNNEGYFPENCRWATPKEQARNRSSNSLIEYDGRTQCIAAWCEEFGIGRCTLRARIKRGWSIERALNQPIDKNRRNSRSMKD